MKFKNLFGFGKLTALGFTQEDAQGHDTSGSISVCHPHFNDEYNILFKLAPDLVRFQVLNIRASMI